MQRTCSLVDTHHSCPKTQATQVPVTVVPTQAQLFVYILRGRFQEIITSLWLKEFQGCSLMGDIIRYLHRITTATPSSNTSKFPAPFYTMTTISMTPAKNLIFVVPCIMLNSEIIPTRCNNCVYSSQWLYSTCFG